MRHQQAWNIPVYQIASVAKLLAAAAVCHLFFGKAVEKENMTYNLPGGFASICYL